MGWTYTNKPSNVSVKDFFEQEFGGKVIDAAVVNFKECYMLYQNQEGKVLGLVCLLDYAPKDYYNFGYKDMTEGMGPCYYNCPERILKQLPPTDNHYALEWRQTCWNKLAKRKAVPKLEDGMTIRFQEPLSFTDGRILQDFVVVKRGRKTLFYNGGLYQITKWKERSFDVVSPNPKAV